MRKAAMFDLDNTLTLGPSSERIFIRYLFKKKEINMGALLRTVFKFLKNLGRWDKMVLQNKYYLREKPIERLKQIANECFLNRIDKLVPPDMIRIIQFHRDRGDLLILISGTLSFIVDIFAQSLLFDDKRGTGLEVIDGKLTGRLDSIHPYGQGKVAILNEFIEKYEIDMANSTIYANHFTDRFMMEKAGKPVAVNPDRNLLKYAKNHGWQVLNIR